MSSTGIRPEGVLCGARKTDGSGDTCQNAAGKNTGHVGFGYCAFHSGATPNGEKHGEKLRAAWLSRLEGEIDPSLNTVVVLRDDQAVDPRVRLAASKDLLDRAGVKVQPDELPEGVEIVIRWPERA